MNLRAWLTFLKRYPMGLLLRIDRETIRFFHACFVSALAAQPFAQRMAKEDMSVPAIAGMMGVAEDCPELKSWLDFGASVGALRSKNGMYGLKSRTARAVVAGPEAWRAYFRVRVEIFHRHILDTPDMLAQGKRFRLEDSTGELYAQSSRTVEPLLLEATPRLVPPSGPCLLLEAGCGSGVYIRAACETNPELRVVGIETQPSAAELARRNIKEWGLAGRAEILTTDIREHHAPGRYDMVTMHNMIYYFPVKDRPALLDHMKGLLKPGGRIALTTLTSANFPATRAMDLWSSMNQGCGPLPTKQEIEQLLESTGFQDTAFEEIIPGFWCFTART